MGITSKLAKKLDVFRDFVIEIRVKRERMGWKKAGEKGREKISRK